MRILFLEARPEYGGGSERVTLDLLRHAAAQGHDVALAYDVAGNMLATYREVTDRIARLPMAPISIRHPWHAWRHVSRLRSHIVRGSFDIVFSSCIGYASLMTAAASGTGAKSAMHLGFVIVPSRGLRSGLRALHARLVPSAHVAVAWHRHLGDDTPITVVANGVDLSRFQMGDGRAAARDRLGIFARDTPVISYVGRLVPEKGVLTLVRAFAATRRRGLTAILLLVGGGAERDISEIRSLAAAEGLPQHAWEIRPPTDRPEDVYRASDVVVVPSEWDEPFGLVPIEAMACGTLTLVSNRGVLPELVAPLGDSVVFRSGNADELSDRLLDWLVHDDRRRAAAAVLAGHVRSTFAFARCGDAYLAAFAGIGR